MPPATCHIHLGPMRAPSCLVILSHVLSNSGDILVIWLSGSSSRSWSWLNDSSRSSVFFHFTDMTKHQLPSLKNIFQGCDVQLLSYHLSQSHFMQTTLLRYLISIVVILLICLSWITGSELENNHKTWSFTYISSNLSLSDKRVVHLASLFKPIGYLIINSVIPTY